MPKKGTKNAFFYFMLEFKRQEELKGRRFPRGIPDVVEPASEPWKRLTSREKEKYEKMAKEGKHTEKKPGERYTSQGKALSEVRKEVEEREWKVADHKRKIVQLIDEAIEQDRLDTNPFYIISFNYFEKDVTKSPVRYYPCEVGLVRFSIRNGITLKYHNLINPGPLPLGSGHTSRVHRDKTHKLPLPPEALGESDYVVILDKMLEIFVQENSTMKGTFPVLVMEEEMEMVESILFEFCKKSEMDFDTIQILPLTYFFFRLRVAVDKVFCELESEFSFAIAHNHLERDMYQYYSGHGCRSHEVDDVNFHCALSRPTRWAYYIIDQTIGIIGGKKKAGYHYPKGCVIDEDYDENDDDEQPKIEKIETFYKVKQESPKNETLYMQRHLKKEPRYEEERSTSRVSHHSIEEDRDRYHRHLSSERLMRERKDSDRSSSRLDYRSGSSESRSLDSRLIIGESKYDEVYLRAKKAKLEAELALLEKKQKKSSKRRRSRSRTRSRSRDRSDRHSHNRRHHDRHDRVYY